MTIANYTELQEEVISLVHRDGETSVEAKVPLWVRLAEARMNRKLRVVDMEESLVSTALVNGAATLPTGFRAFKELRYDGDSDHTLQPKSIEFIRSREISTGAPKYYAVTKSTVQCDGVGSIQGTYYEDIPPLASNSTNWLLDKHPDLYLFATLVEAAIWLDHDKLPLWAERAAALIQAVQDEDDRNQFDGGTLAIRAR